MAELDGTAVAGLEVAGRRQAPPLLLVHGSVVSRKIWLPQLASLSHHYRVIAPDLPGHGDLAHQPFTFDAAVELLVATLDREASGRAVVVGLSLGGYVALELAHRCPERVAALVLCGCSRNFMGAAGIYLRAVSELMRRGWLAQSQEQMERKTMRIFPPELAHVAEEQLRAGVRGGPLPNAFTAMAGRDWGAVLAEFPGPALILNGERDSMARKQELRFAASAQKARVRTIAGAGHACNLDQPAAFDREVLEFLSTVGPPWSLATPS